MIYNVIIRGDLFVLVCEFWSSYCPLVWDDVRTNRRFHKTWWQISQHIFSGEQPLNMRTQATVVVGVVTWELSLWRSHPSPISRCRRLFGRSAGGGQAQLVIAPLISSLVWLRYSVLSSLSLHVTLQACVTELWESTSCSSVSWINKSAFSRLLKGSSLYRPDWYKLVDCSW